MLAKITISATKARIVNKTTLVKRRVGAKATPSDANMAVSDVTADFSVVDPQRIMCTYRPVEGFLVNYSHMHGVCGSISSQYAVRGLAHAGR